MNGILIVAIVVLLIAVIGLGFGILTLNERIEKMDTQLGNYTTYDQYRELVNDVIKCETDNSKWLSEVSITANRLSAEFASFRKATKGTANETEFCRMKTQVWNVLTPSVEDLQKVVGVPPVITVSKDALVDAAVKARKYENPALSFSKVLPADDELTKIMFADLITKEEEKDNDGN